MTAAGNQENILIYIQSDLRCHNSLHLRVTDGHSWHYSSIQVCKLPELNSAEYDGDRDVKVGTGGTLIGCPEGGCAQRAFRAFEGIRKHTIRRMMPVGSVRTLTDNCIVASLRSQSTTSVHEKTALVVNSGCLHYGSAASLPTRPPLTPPRLSGSDP
jgi:hypothetical protein